MKKLLLIVFFSQWLYGISQEGQGLLVYAVKGDVSVVEYNQEAKLKIGKVLRPGAIIKTGKDSKLTMVCKEGKPISVIVPGEYPVLNWKDSCKTTHNSITTSYFQYVWTELYVRSPEGGDELRKSGNKTYSRVSSPLRSESDESKNIVIQFSAALDTINYTSGDFPLSWKTDHEGKFLFQLFSSPYGKLIFSDSVSGKKIMMSAFSKLLEPGKSYRWFIGTKGFSIRRPHVINCFPPEVEKDFIGSIRNIEVPEDAAAENFRIGYFLEKNKWLASVYWYYLEAIKLDKEQSLYLDKLAEFCNEFGIQIGSLKEEK